MFARSALAYRFGSKQSIYTYTDTYVYEKENLKKMGVKI